ncbi:hypothetical protein B0T20DRAFT_479748 [Sordaria brevicollis]|uniref:Uncharacterized protein n=1 Tax=Sordaria brevicollis TaxID=83679 RepID=A0AAE0PCS2_SORBR|nr:hypothetical protein B0T20DRAFT_479748 [Sordaria brevicollis]
MVHLPTSLSLAATLSFLTLIAAAPTTPTTTSTSDIFSFAKWVNDLITHPDTALSPEEAWQAYLDTLNSTSVAIEAANDKAEKRWDAAVQCNDFAPGPAWAPDAVWCINYLAAKGSTACVVNDVSYFCTHGRARITGVSGGGRPESSCQDAAQTAGLIMDTCTRSNQYVEGSRMNVRAGVQMYVHIRAP